MYNFNTFYCDIGVRSSIAQPINQPNNIIPKVHDLTLKVVTKLTRAAYYLTAYRILFSQSEIKSQDKIQLTSKRPRGNNSDFGAKEVNLILPQVVLVCKIQVISTAMPRDQSQNAYYFYSETLFSSLTTSNIKSRLKFSKLNSFFPTRNSNKQNSNNHFRIYSVFFYQKNNFTIFGIFFIILDLNLFGAEHAA